MLTEREWAEVEPLLTDAIKRVQANRQEKGCSLADAMQVAFGQDALAAYERLTGFKESNARALYHHRLSIYGPPCHECGKPLRTPQARICAACSAERRPDLQVVR